MKQPAVYMLSSQRNGTLYIGVTSDLIQRVWQHKEGLAEGCTKKYAVKMLVWFEQHETMKGAIRKENAMKKWLRKWKLKTIEQTNPDWNDLWFEIIGEKPQTVVPALLVIPAQAGIQQDKQAGTQQKENAFDSLNPLDSRLRGNDGALGGAR
jgi:putative endonuclease